MKKLIVTFLKWFVLGFLLLVFTIGVAIWKDNEVEFNVPRLLAIAGLGAFFLGLFFLFLELGFVPMRKRVLMRKVQRIFGAQEVGVDQALYEVGGFQFFIKIKIALSMSQYFGNAEVIEFHFPRDQYDWTPIKPDVPLNKDYFANIPTYRIINASAFGLKRAKKRIDKIVVTSDFLL